MRYFCGVLLLTALLGLPSLSLAQTIFNVTGSLTLVNGSLAGTTVGSFSGTIDINTTTGNVVSWNISMPAIPANPSYGVVGAYTFSPSDSTVYFTPSGPVNPLAPGYLTFSNTGQELVFAISAQSLVGFGGASFSGGPNGSGYGLASGEGFTMSGTVAPSPVPEPPTLALMASGLLGMVCFRRKLFEIARRSRST
jgi:hypothetical protein